MLRCSQNYSWGKKNKKSKTKQKLTLTTCMIKKEGTKIN